MFGVYVHIPFCSSRCPFCDFTLVTGAKETLIDDYVNALCEEIRTTDTTQWPETLTSIFFGGGTPSLLSTNQLEKILNAIRFTFAGSAETEITLETNPEDVVRKRAKEWKLIGFNRISLGVQSMNDEELKRLGRHHIKADVIRAMERLRDQKIENVSVDLLFGLEKQTIEKWKQTLDSIFLLSPEHISTYNLTIEKNTKYQQEWDSKHLKLPSDETQSEMMIRSKEWLEKNNYYTYEISNAARPGFESQHNLLYWTGKPYLGFGVSSHSFFHQDTRRRRWWNTKNIPQYIQAVKSGQPAIAEEEEISVDTHVMERVMTGLRLKHGISFDEFQRDQIPVSSKILEQFHRLTESGHLKKTGSFFSIPRNYIPLTSEILLRIFS